MSLDAESSQQRVGFEIEYIGLELKEAAHLIASLYEGDAHPVHDTLYHIDTPLGTFKVEVDVQLLEKLSMASQDNVLQNKMDFEGAAMQMLTPILNLFAPHEIVCPPIDVDSRERLEPLRQALREAGAKGTSASLSYAFGLHINPETLDTSCDNILAHIQAFVLLYDYLKEIMQMDMTRVITLFAKAYPLKYALKILDPDYQPSQNVLIKDYMMYVKSRNFALDCYPLFLYLDEKQVRAKMPDPLIQARPTFHFRMPNCRLDDPSWSFEQEWQHWRLIEKLSSHHDLRAQMAEAFLNLKEPLNNMFSKKWLKLSKKMIQSL